MTYYFDPHPGVPYLANISTNLGIALTQRFGRSGDLFELDRAVEAFQSALNETGLRDIRLPAHLSNLAATLHDRYSMRGDESDLNESLELMRRSVDATPINDIDRPKRLFNLGMGLRARFTLRGDEQDLDEAVAKLNEVVVAAEREFTRYRVPSFDTLDLPLWLDGLAQALLTRYKRHGSRSDLQAAIRALSRAIDACPEGYPRRPVLQSDHGDALRERYELLNDGADLHAAVDIYRAASNEGKEAAPMAVLDLATSWGEWATGREAWDEASEAYRFAQEAWERLVHLQLTRPDTMPWT